MTETINNQSGIQWLFCLTSSKNIFIKHFKSAAERERECVLGVCVCVTVNACSVHVMCVCVRK